MSIPMIREAPAALQPSATARPTAPRPHTAHVLPGSTLAVLSAAPYPVGTPHPSKQTLSSGAVRSTCQSGARLLSNYFLFFFSPWTRVTLAREISATTVYCENVEQPIKWAKVFPLQVNREVPSGMRPLPWVARILLQRLVFGDLQNLQSPHCGMYRGTTWSPEIINSTWIEKTKTKII